MPGRRYTPVSQAIVRYAGSSYYGYAGRITNIQDAISRVLGYDMVFNLALGLASGRSFRVPDEGPLGLTRFWEHSVCCAAMVQRLGSVLPEPIRPPSGFSWLCGLLHDFGLLLLGHLFPPEFRLLNKLAAAHPELAVNELEQRLLGMGEALVRGMDTDLDESSMPEHSLTVLHLLPAQALEAAQKVVESKNDLLALSGMLSTAS